jgi:hypothetical protein
MSVFTVSTGNFLLVRGTEDIDFWVTQKALHSSAVHLHDCMCVNITYSTCQMKSIHRTLSSIDFFQKRDSMPQHTVVISATLDKDHSSKWIHIFHCQLKDNITTYYVSI